MTIHFWPKSCGGHDGHCINNIFDTIIYSRVLEWINYSMKSTKVQTLSAGQIAYTEHLVGNEDTRHHVIEEELYYLSFTVFVQLARKVWG